MKEGFSCNEIHKNAEEENYDEFLREPVQDTLKEIEKLEASKIILRKEGLGRSTLLNYMQEKKANTEQPFLLLNLSGDNLP